MDASENTPLSEAEARLARNADALGDAIAEFTAGKIPLGRLGKRFKEIASNIREQKG